MDDRRHLCKACRADISDRLAATAGRRGRPPVYCSDCSARTHPTAFAAGYAAALDALADLDAAA